MKNIFRISIKYIQLIMQGDKLRDKLILTLYFLKRPFLIFREKSNKDYSLSRDVTIKSKEGIFFCGDNIFSVWAGSSFHERNLRKYFKLTEGGFVDIGANIGKFSILLGKMLGPKGDVFAIEPHPKNFQILKRNIELNKLTNVYPFELACSDSNGVLDLFIDKEGTGGHSLIKSKESKAGSSCVRVQVKKLDDLVKKLKIKKIGLIKIDVEGAESYVLAGGKEVLKRDHPKIIFESWNDDYLKMVKEILQPLKYKFKKISDENYLAY